MTIVRNATIITIPADKFVLVVEDNAERIEWFETALKGTMYHIRTNTQHALEFFSERVPPDVVFLDHDAVPFFVALNDPDHEDKTFFRVAQRLARDNFSGLVVIHSGNPVGAKRMADTISERADATVVIAPFGSFKIERTCVRD